MRGKDRGRVTGAGRVLAWRMEWRRVSVVREDANRLMRGGIAGQHRHGVRSLRMPARGEEQRYFHSSTLLYGSPYILHVPSDLPMFDYSYSPSCDIMQIGYEPRPKLSVDTTGQGPSSYPGSTLFSSCSLSTAEPIYSPLDAYSPSPPSMHDTWPIVLPPLIYQPYGVARSPTHAYSRRAAAAPYSANAAHHRRSLPFLYSVPPTAPSRALAIAHRHPVSLPANQYQLFVSSPSVPYHPAPPPPHLLPPSASAPPLAVPSQHMPAYSTSHSPPYPTEPKPLVLHQPRPVRPIPPIEIPDPAAAPRREPAPETLEDAPGTVEDDDEYDDDDPDDEWDVDDGQAGPTISREISRPGSIPLLCQPLSGYSR